MFIRFECNATFYASLVRFTLFKSVFAFRIIIWKFEWRLNVAGYFKRTWYTEKISTVLESSMFCEIEWKEVGWKKWSNGTHKIEFWSLFFATFSLRMRTKKRSSETKWTEFSCAALFCIYCANEKNIQSFVQ